MAVAERIRKWREAKGLTQEELAEIVGVTRSAINQWEKRTPKLREHHIHALASALDQPPSTFTPFGGGTVTPIDGRKHPILWLRWEDLRHVSAGGKVLKEAIKKPTYVDASKEISKKSLMLTIQDDSMRPVFAPGDDIIIDPELKPAETDTEPEYVLVRITKTGEEIFRRYVARRGGAYDLVAESEDWDTVSISARNPGEMLGVLAEHRKKRRTR
jgi:transcriptional regulator with XRE-family HTH domain